MDGYTWFFALGTTLAEIQAMGSWRVRGLYLSLLFAKAKVRLHWSGKSGDTKVFRRIEG